MIHEESKTKNVAYTYSSFAVLTLHIILHLYIHLF